MKFLFLFFYYVFSLNYKKIIYLLNFTVQRLRKKPYVQDCCCLSPISTVCSGYYFVESPQKDRENCKYLKIKVRGQKLYCFCFSKSCRSITDSDNIFFVKSVCMSAVQHYHQSEKKKIS